MFNSSRAAAALAAALAAVASAQPLAAAPLLGPDNVWVGVVANDAGVAVPFTAQVQGVAGFCLRFQTLRQDLDLEVAVIAPNGGVYVDDDGGSTSACPQCSLVKIDPEPSTGFYTVQVSQFAGAPVDTAFELQVGQFLSGSAECASPTPPRSVREAGSAGK